MLLFQVDVANVGGVLRSRIKGFKKKTHFGNSKEFRILQAGSFTDVLLTLIASKKLQSAPSWAFSLDLSLRETIETQER
jgi:hypothetical protein